MSWQPRRQQQQQTLNENDEVNDLDGLWIIERNHEQRQQQQTIFD